MRSGCEADFDQLVARTAAGIRAHEPGTLFYACHAVDGAPRQRIFRELYRDRAAFAEHEAQPRTRRFLAEREALLEAAASPGRNLAAPGPAAVFLLRPVAESTGH